MKKRQFITPRIVVVKLSNEVLMTTGSMGQGEGNGGGPSAKRSMGFVDFYDED